VDRACNTHGGKDKYTLFLVSKYQQNRRDCTEKVPEGVILK
jgi:hypothetical protein